MAKNKIITLKDIAEQAEVSISLVSFVLSGKAKQHRVKDEVAQRVRDIAKVLNYVPNIMARSLRDGRSRTIGVVVSDISNPFFANLTRQIEKAAEQFNYSVTFSSSDENAEHTDSQVNNMINRGVDCIILVPCEGSEQTIIRMMSNETPFVLLDRYFPELNTNYVCLNNRNASYEATSHLIEQGFNKIGMINYDFKLINIADRITGYETAMCDAKLEANIIEEFVNHDSMVKSCNRALKKMFEKKIDALICGTNAITVECLHNIKNRKIIIPEQLGLVGFDGGNAFDFFYSPLTYIQQPLEIMARKSVQILMDQLDSKVDYTQHVAINGDLIIQNSSVRTL